MNTPNQINIYPKYKHNHIGGNNSFSTFYSRTVNVKEKYILSN